MGYTHYLNRPKNLNKEKFTLLSRLVPFVEDVVRTKGVQLNNKSEPHRVNINGVGELGHENLYVPRNYKPMDWEQPKEDNTYFSFCKTAHKPYDSAVTATLLLMKMLFGTDVKIRSDGWAHEWVAGYEVAVEALELARDNGLLKSPTYQVPHPKTFLREPQPA